MGVNFKCRVAICLTSSLIVVGATPSSAQTAFDHVYLYGQAAANGDFSQSQAQDFYTHPGSEMFVLSNGTNAASTVSTVYDVTSGSFSFDGAVRTSDSRTYGQFDYFFTTSVLTRLNVSYSSARTGDSSLYLRGIDLRTSDTSTSILSSVFADNSTDSLTVDFGPGSYYLQFVDGLGGNDQSAAQPGTITDRFQYSLSNAPAVPETATWAMMLVGFGGLGLVMRRRQANTRVRFA